MKGDKKFILLVFALMAALYLSNVFVQKPPVAPPAPTPAPQPAPVVPPKELTYDEVIALIRAEDVKRYVETLASKEFEGRGTGAPGNDKAAEYIKKHLDALGIPYKEQTFSARGKQTRNIIAYLIPRTVKSNDVIVLGAHFDHLGTKGDTYYPGADDNASGTAGVMAAATALSKYRDRLNHVVLLQFYSAEELGLLGSKYYTEHPLFPESNPDINKHIAMINMDMIGYLSKKYEAGVNTTTYRDEAGATAGVFATSAVDLKSVVGGLASKYSFATSISGYKPGGSDHSPFLSKSVPAVFLHTGTHPYYHKPTDTPDRLNYPGLAQVAKLAVEILLAVDKNG